MKNLYFRKYGVLLITLLLGILVIVTVSTVSHPLPYAKECTDVLSKKNVSYNPETGEVTETVQSYTCGEDLTAIRISDLSGLSVLTKVNYTPDEFVTPDKIDENSRIVDLKDPSFSFAERGTLQFIILNLDPYAEDFKAQSEALAPYKTGDYWHFTLAVPQIFTACNIYQKSQCVARLGEIEGYDFTKYNTNFQIVTEKHTQHTERTYLDLTFYPRREVMDQPLSAAQIVTIHYEADSASMAGIREFAVIGEEAAVKKVTGRNITLLTVFSAASALTLAVFLFLCALKRTLSYVPQLLISFGIFASFLSEGALERSTGLPLLWQAINLSSVPFMLFAALLVAGIRCRKFPLRLVAAGIPLLSTVLSFLIPFTAAETAHFIDKITLILNVLSVILLIVSIIVKTFDRGSDVRQLINPLLLALTVAVHFILPRPQFVMNDPSFWMFTLMITMTFLVSFHVFVLLERRNRYLTANLQAEVVQQTKDLQALLQERDDLLRYVSHDLKKPLLAAGRFLDEISEQEISLQEQQTLEVVRQKNTEVLNGLTEIAKFSKLHYVAEVAEMIDLEEMSGKIFRNLNPDCIANGILLRNEIQGNFKIFAKPKCLESCIFNIILNAVEHAECSVITLRATKQHGRCILTVADNGKGISGEYDIFKPYVSENPDAETNGLGLYLCKKMMLSMNGELSYLCENNETKFMLSLPPA